MSERPRPHDENRDPVAELVDGLPLLMLVGGLAATGFAIGNAVGVIALILGALFGLPEFKLDDTTYEGAWMLFRFGPLLFLHGGLSAAVAYGIWKGRYWSRSAVVAFWLSAIVSASVAAMLYPRRGDFWLTVAIGCVPILLLSWFYHYHVSKVVAYFDELSDSGGEHEQQ